MKYALPDGVEAEHWRPAVYIPPRPVDVYSGEFVYLIRFRGESALSVRPSDSIKIGVSSNPHKRLFTLQREWKDSSARLVGIRAGGYPQERIEHKRFSDARTDGEFFRNEGKLRELVEYLEFAERCVRSFLWSAQ